MVHTARCSLRFKSTAQIVVAVLVVTWCSIVGGLLKCFSRGVCNHQCFPRRISAGLPISTSAGSSRPVMRTLIQLQHVPVQTLRTMEEEVRSFHCPAYRVADLFHVRGGTGGRSVNCFPRACAFAFRFFHLERCEEKERADPRAAWMAALLNIAGASSTRAERGMAGVGFFFVVWVSFSRALSASLSERSSTRSCAWMTSKYKATT